MSWMDVWGFKRNPFDTTPVKRINMDMYIDRDEVKKTISAVTGYERGKYVVIGDAGVGKSSTLNYIYGKFSKSTNIIVTFAAQKGHDDEYICNNILGQLIDNVPRGGLTSFMKAGLLGTMTKDKKAPTTAEVIDYPLTKKHDFIIKLGQFIVEEGRKRIIFIVDDLDKFNSKDAIRFLNTLDELINHFDCFLFTTLKRQIDSALRHYVNDSFDRDIPLQNLANLTKAREFVTERVRVCSGVKKSLFHPEALKEITKRANGNLRELFRYCAATMEQFGSTDKESLITKEQAKKGIKLVDEGSLMLVDDVSQAILRIGSEKDEFSANKRFLQIIKEEGISLNYRALINKLNDMVSLNLLHERILKKRKIFTVPRLIRESFRSKESETYDSTEIGEVVKLPRITPIDIEHKDNILHSMNETQLRKMVLVPLFEKMGYKNIVLYHGTMEKGKDIVFCRENEIGEWEYIGVVVKRDKIHGTAGKSGNASEVLIQAQQAFTSPFPDVVTGKDRRIDRVWIITPHNIGSTARESVRENLTSVNIYKSLSFIDGQKLIELIDRYLPQFYFPEHAGFTNYLDALKKEFEKMDLSAIGRREPLPLDEVFVNPRLRRMDIREGDDFYISNNEGIIIAQGRGERVENFKDLTPEQAKHIIEEHENEGKIYGNICEMYNEKSSKDFVIVGDPGSGKTTLLKYLVLQLIQKNIDEHRKEVLPVFISCREFMESEKNVISYINTVLDNYRFTDVKECIERDLKMGKCVLLFDGFDEVADSHEQMALTQKILEFRSEYGKNRYLITSRPMGYHWEFPNFCHVGLLDFDEGQVLKFVDRWFKGSDFGNCFGRSGKEKTEAVNLIKDSIKNNPEINKIARNPLLLSIIATVYEDGKRLPENRVDLYDACIDVLLYRWDKYGGARYNFPSDKKKEFLRSLAFYAHENGKKELVQKDIYIVAKEHFPRLKLGLNQKDEFIEELWSRNYLLRPVSQTSYSFLHLSFQEYFAALELAHRPDGIDHIIKHLHKSWWQEVILLYAGKKRDASNLVNWIEKEEEDIFYNNLFLSAKCVVDAGFTKETTRKVVVDSLVDVYGKFSFLKGEIIYLLSNLDLKRVESIYQKEKNSNARHRIVNALARIGTNEIKTCLMRLFKNEKDSSIQMGIIEEIGWLGGEDVVEFLLKIFNKETDRDLLELIGQWLALWGKENTTAFFMKVLKNEKDNDLRRRLILPLFLSDEENVKNDLMEILKYESDTVVRRRIIRILALTYDEDVKTFLVNLLKDGNNLYDQRSIIETLGWLGGEDVKALLIELIKREIDNDLRMEIIVALNRIGGEDVKILLIELINKEVDNNVRGEIVRALNRIGGEDVKVLFFEFIRKEKNKNVRKRIIDAIGTMGGKDVKVLLMELINEETDKENQGRIIDCLGKIGGEDVEELLICHIREEEDRYLRGRIINALGVMGGMKVKELFMKLLREEKYPDSEIRIIDVLCEFGGDDVKTMFMDIIKEKKFNQIRWRIIEGIVKLGGEREFFEILEMLNSRKISKPIKKDLFRPLWKISLRIDKRVARRKNKYVEVR